MKKLLLIPLIALAFSACNNYDDFAISGTIIAIEQCTTTFDVGYAVQIDDSIGNIGGDYRYVSSTTDTTFHNVIVIYRPDRIIQKGSHITGRAFWEEKYSKAYCNYHYRSSTGEVPEACFSKLEIDD